jgi:hypothetical protein
VNGETTNQSLELYYESSPGSFTLIDTASDCWGKIRMRNFAEVTVLSGRRIRIEADRGTGASIDVRQVAVGQRLEAEMGQYVDASNPNYTYGYKFNNSISENGSILARSVERIEKMGKLNLEYLTENWYETYWEPFAKHSVKYPFFYQPDPDNNPNAVAFASAEKVSEPQRSGKGSRLNVNWNLRMLSSEENHVSFELRRPQAGARQATRIHRRA